jgi:hypothetical protein
MSCSFPFERSLIIRVDVENMVEEAKQLFGIFAYRREPEPRAFISRIELGRSCKRCPGLCPVTGLCCLDPLIENGLNFRGIYAARGLGFFFGERRCGNGRINF